MAKKANTQTREKIISAAETLVRQEGVAALTLDAVAKAAGFSKGGLLYHFGDKQSLIAAMLDKLFERLRTDHEALLNQEAIGPGRWLRAYLKGAFTPIAQEDLTSALLAGLAHEPQLLSQARQEYLDWQKQALSDGVPEDIALSLLLAADGSWYGSLLGFSFPSIQQEAIYQRLLSWLEDSIRLQKNVNQKHVSKSS